MVVILFSLSIEKMILGTPYLIREAFKPNLRERPPVTYAFDPIGRVQGVRSLFVHMGDLTASGDSFLRGVKEVIKASIANTR